MKNEELKSELRMRNEELRMKMRNVEWGMEN
jgi:hypothetical protein